MVKVEVMFLDSEAVMPSFAHKGDAGADLYALQDTAIKAGHHVLVRTGIAIALPKGYEAQIRPRSGLALKHGITVLNTPGTVDEGYRGEIGVILANTSRHDFLVEKHSRIAQMVVKKTEKVVFSKARQLKSTVRNKTGFGDSGR